MSLGIGLLQGPMEGGVLMSEVPLYLVDATVDDSPARLPCRPPRVTFVLLLLFLHAAAK